MTENQLYLLINYLEARFELEEKSSPYAADSKAGRALDRLVESLRQTESNQRVFNARQG